MGFITSNQGRPIQGVSQQPEKTRLPGQCTLSENLRPDIVRGLINRQGTEASAELTAALLSSYSKWYYYNRGTNEEYFISIEAGTGDLKVWSPSGVQHIVNVEAGASNYIGSPNPRKFLRLMTIGDYTFIVNTEKKVYASSSTSPPISHKAIIYCQFMDYGQRVQLYIDDALVATYCAPDGGDASHHYYVNPEYVIERLMLCLAGGSGENTSGALEGKDFGWIGTDITADYDFYSEGNTIVIERKDHASFSIRATDEVDNANTVAIQGKIENTSMLPGTAPEGFIVEVDPPGSTKSDNANFFLKAKRTNSNHVTWEETIAPDISLGLDASTMPYVLVRESITSGVATFSLRKGEWADREVGNDETNPQPTFVDPTNPLTIQSIGLFQNRLFVTSGESVIMTRSNDFFNFYRETTQAALDTDPIDIFADVPQINYLITSLAFDGDLIFFSTTSQFLLDGSKPVTRDNATLRRVTSFEAQLSVDPVASGDAIFFAFKYGVYTGIREFFTDSITDTKKARPVTDHVKEYIKGAPDIMASSTNLNLLLIKTKEDKNILYTYDWLWQGTEKVQSSWGKIVFPETDEVLHFEFVDETLWLVILRDGNSIWIEKVNMGDPDDSILGFPVRLDRKVYRVFNYDSGSGRYFTLDPYPDVPIEDLIAVRSTGAYLEDIGTAIDISRDGAGNLITTEELSAGGGPVYSIIGRRYTCKYSPTNPVALDEKGYALNLDRLTIGSFYMNYNTSGPLSATVESKYGAVREYQYSNRTLGGPENLVGFAPLVGGQHRVSIRQRSDQYTLTFMTNSHLPLEVRDFEYNGNLNRRGRRL